VENEFFDEDNKFIVCATHGALYQPQSGVCVAGPCNGKNLIAMPYEIANDFIVVTV
jgi:nitrite reductase/ring-hydroxylating ferredoxin subunit